MIELKSISKSFNGRVILNNVSTTFEKGHINLVIGGSGSGKTVMMKCMVGLVDVDGGELWYDGKIFSGLDKKNANPSVRKLEWFFRVEPYLIL